MAVARDIKGKRERIVSVISNGTTMAGQLYEAMSNAGYLDLSMVVILNEAVTLYSQRLMKAPRLLSMLFLVP